ncbi:MAG: pantoate--beta-alanine ligase [Gammaproteobacteria bacterium]|nr:pantoate--beta-alanine ligase [Gammaproteobacteria bacterium]MDH4315138.1 pantoate--beta-alanine ligase [Gammaproteobacteria bacterium]MDH5214239.1 pantoate--beta-alanine ligase [Gammaproteobacteria bacterium]
MKIVSTAEALREQLGEWRRAGDHIALVPTMGNLHDGHLSLVRIAREHAERVIISVFVNPTQFGEDEDFEKYPRTLERDKLKLKKVSVDLLFVPEVATMYPFGIDKATTVTVPALNQELCGSFRPGHFDGVATVVSRLFGLVQPDVAVFGQKDYQQLLVIRRLAEDLNLAVKIIAGPTLRDEDGLAMSSRNQYLTDEERKIAPELYRVLEKTAEALHTGNRDYAALEKSAVEQLTSSGFKPEYLSIRRAENLDAPDRDEDHLVILVAAHLGEARLIDNLLVEI